MEATRLDRQDAQKRYPTMRKSDRVLKCTCCHLWHPAWAVRVVNGGKDQWCAGCISRKGKRYEGKEERT